jgi:cell division protein FtsA
MKSDLVTRLKPLLPRRPATLAALDVGTSKIACLIARLTPKGEIAPGDWRTHRIRIVGIGHQRSLGVKHGLVIDMDEAERAIRHTVDAAERMAGMQVERVIVTASGGRFSSEHFAAKRRIGGREVAEADIHRVLEASAAHHLHRGRVAVHSLPTGFSLDGVSGIHEPKDMIGEELGVDLHVASCDQAAVRNLVLAVERGHLGVEGMAAAPYAGGLAAL